LSYVYVGGGQQIGFGSFQSENSRKGRVIRRRAMKCAMMRIRHGLWLAVVWALAACGGSGGGMSSMNSSSPAQSTPQACSNCGMAMVSMTDAPGDFISYMVNVVSLQLKRADGTVVETVPVTTQVDFAQLVNLSEIISAEQIPAGNYVSAAMTLDFSSATIVVDNGTTAVTIAAGNVINGATSLPLAAPNPTQMTLNLDLSHSQFIVTQHAIANLALDFNLAASNTIAPSDTNPMTVTVNPVLTASLVPDATKQIRVRGPLVSADPSASSYIISVRPFFNSSGTAGQFTVDTTATTTFSINNVSSVGGAGLTQLAAVTAGTIVVAYGAWDNTTQTFTASNVLAGTSVPGMMHDSAEGTVLSRTGNILTVADGVLFPIETDGAADDMLFARQVAVTVGSGTTVTEDGQMGPFTIQDISVGQHLQLSGKIGQDSSGNPTLDATAGSARLMMTTLSGTVTGLAAELGHAQPAEPRRPDARTLQFCGNRNQHRKRCDRGRLRCRRAQRAGRGSRAQRRRSGALHRVRCAVRPGAARLQCLDAVELRADSCAARLEMAAIRQHGTVRNPDEHGASDHPGHAADHTHALHPHRRRVFRSHDSGDRSGVDSGSGSRFPMAVDHPHQEPDEREFLGLRRFHRGLEDGPERHQRGGANCRRRSL
jgi:hypothetical protein